MKRLLIAATLASAVAAVMLSGPSSSAQEGFAVKETEDVVELLAVDTSRRTATVMTSAGKEVVLSVPSEVYDLKKLEPGTKLDIKYAQEAAETVALSISPRGSAETRMEIRRPGTDTMYQQRNEPTRAPR